MSFPVNDYKEAIAELQATVLDRDAKGRNETNDFYSQFPHGVSDLTFELHRRVQRILGAEKIGDLETVYGDTLDLANYAVFLLMFLSHGPNPAPNRLKTSSASPPPYLAQAYYDQQAALLAAPAYSQPPDSRPLGPNTWSNTYPPCGFPEPSCQPAE